MAENVGAIYYTVEADTEKLLDSSNELDKSLSTVEKRFATTDKAANAAEFQMTKTAKAVRNLGRESERTSNSMSGLSKMLAGLLTLQGVNAVIQMAEGYTEMAERVQMASTSVEEYEMVQQRLLATANGTYRALKESQEVYILTADTLRSMGYTTLQALDITDSLSYSFVKNATAVDRAETATRAFSNAMMKGRLEADAFSSILAATPSIIEDIADAAGISSEEVRRLGAEGKLTATMLSEGLRKSLDDNKKAADGMSTTVRDAITSVKNSLSAYLGEMNNSTGATNLLSKSIISLGNNLDALVTTFLILGAGGLAKYIAQTGLSAIENARAAISARAHAAEELKLATANAAATAEALRYAQVTSGLTTSHIAAQRAADAHAQAELRLAAARRAAAAAGVGLLNILGGPAGLVGLVAAASVAFLTLGDNAAASQPKIDLLTKSLTDLSDANLRVVKADLTKKISELESVGGAAFRALANIGQLQKKINVDPNNKNIAKWREELDRWTVSLENAKKEISDYKNQLIDLEKEEGKRKSSSGAAYLKTADPEAAARLKAMRDELALAKLTGESRAKLQAIQKLGDKATEDQKAEAAALAAQIYNLENARKKSATATKEDTKNAEENRKVMDELAQSLLEVGMEAEDLAVAKAKAKLNQFATPQEVANVEAMARAIYQVNEAEANKKLLNQVDPMAAENARYATELENLRKLNEAKLLLDARYYELKNQAEIAHNAQMQLLAEQNFKSQSQWNAMLIDGFNALSSAGGGALANIMTGATSAGDALRSLASSVLNQAINGFIQLGIAQVKAWLMGKLAQNSAAAGYLASVTGQVAANTALAAQAAFASTAAIPITGPTMAPAAAAAAATAAAALGAPATAAAAASFGGGRQYGGNVSPGKFYRINEAGAPEILNTNGRQYLMMNQSSGNVQPLQKSSGGIGGGGGITVNISISGDGSTKTDAPTGMEQFGKEIGEFVERKYNELEMRSYRQGGFAWQQKLNG